MERLTDEKIVEEAKTHIAQCNSKGFPVDYICQRYVRLAAYEDTGLEPEEVMAMIKEVVKFEEIGDSIEKHKDVTDDDDAISREAAIRACEDWLDRMGIRGLHRLGLLISIKYLSPVN